MGIAITVVVTRWDGEVSDAVRGLAPLVRPRVESGKRRSCEARARLRAW